MRIDQRLALAVLAGALAACDPGSVLLVDVRTDLAPGLEFDAVVVRPSDARGPGEAVRREAAPGEDFAIGTRAAELDGLVRGDATVEVALTRNGEEILRRPVRVRLDAPAQSVTVLLAGSCLGVACLEGEACLAGRCVDDRCSETDSEFCEPAECVEDADCPAPGAPCASAECTPSRVCFAAPDHGACAAALTCDADAGCVPPGVPMVFDLGAGLEANLVADAGSGVDATQTGADGFWYHYDRRTLFARYGALGPAEMDGSSWNAMERVRADIRAGWFGTATGAAVGDRGYVYLLREGAFVTSDGDALHLAPENARHPVVEWRAAEAGWAEMDVMVGARADVADADTEVHLFAVGADGATELDFAYLSRDGLPDANGTPTEAAPPEAPRRFRGGAAVDPGDGLFLYARCGDDDAFDGVTVQGAVRFWPAAE